MSISPNLHLYLKTTILACFLLCIVGCSSNSGEDNSNVKKQTSKVQQKKSTKEKKKKKKPLSPDDPKIKKAEEALAKEANFDNHSRLASLYLNSKQYEKTIAICDKALAINDKSNALRNTRCLAYTHLEDWDMAEKACQDALKRAPDGKFAKANYGWMQRKRKEAIGK